MERKFKTFARLSEQYPTRSKETRHPVGRRSGPRLTWPILKQMATKAKKILITTESHEVFVVRRGEEKSWRGFCPRCTTEVELLTLDTAVSVSGHTTRELLRRAESGAVYAIEPRAAICSSALTV